MHGRNRKEFKAKRGSSAAAKKALQLRVLEQEVLLFRKKCLAFVDRDVDLSVGLGLSRNYLLLNPDPLWTWSFRRELLAKTDVSESYEPSCLSPLSVQSELEVTTTCLQSNPKSYGAWLHRKWLSLRHPGRADFWLAELELTVVFFESDERNFHCWNYRRHIVASLLGLGFFSARKENDITRVLPLFGPQVCCEPAVTGLPGREAKRIILGEWEFSSRKVYDNFSNFSAYHYRCCLVCQYTRELLFSDWDVIESAIFTDPYEYVLPP
jgi:geranylgeranyl transferase type-2 subunit alpha